MEKEIAEHIVKSAWNVKEISKTLRILKLMLSLEIDFYKYRKDMMKLKETDNKF